MHAVRVAIVVAALAALTLGALGSYLGSRTRAPDIPGLLWPESKALAPFELDDHRNKTFDLDRLSGNWTLLFFGYTHCPDVCPLTLAVLKNVVLLMEQAGHDGDPLQVVFVSVDPERDTLEHLAAYVTHFNRDFLGVTGSDAKLASFARQLGVLYVRNEPDSQGSYLVDHTAAVFLIDPRGHLVAVFQAPHDAAILAENLPRILELPRG